MLTSERKALIMRALQENRGVVATELAQRFGVSEDTIRRDLRSLADAGLIRRVHGGALPHTPVATTYAGRVEQSVQAKSKIVQAAAKLIQPGQTIFIDAGTTGAALASYLPNDLSISVVTNSLPAAAALVSKPAINVLLLGGSLLHASAATFGASVVNGYALCRADICFLGIASLDVEIGMGVFNHDDAEMKRAMIGAAAQVVAMASAEKLGTTAPFIVAPVSILDHLITETGAPANQIDAIRELGVEVTIA